MTQDVEQEMENKGLENWIEGESAIGVKPSCRANAEMSKSTANDQIVRRGPRVDYSCFGPMLGHGT